MVGLIGFWEFELLPDLHRGLELKLELGLELKLKLELEQELKLVETAAARLGSELLGSVVKSRLVWGTSGSPSSRRRKFKSASTQCVRMGRGHSS